MPSLSLSCPAGVNDTGAYQLEWSGAEGATFRLTENGDVAYEGPEQATTISGHGAGSYAYRLAELDGEGEVAAWSEPCQVEVQPPSLSLAFGLFGAGLLAFIAVTVVIIRGHRAHQRGELE